MRRGTWGAIAVTCIVVGIGFMFFATATPLRIFGAALDIVGLFLLAHSNTKED
jgi:hypothetical protein